MSPKKNKILTHLFSYVTIEIQQLHPKKMLNAITITNTQIIADISAINAALTAANKGTIPTNTTDKEKGLKGLFDYIMIETKDSTDDVTLGVVGQPVTSDLPVYQTIGPSTNRVTVKVENMTFRWRSAEALPSTTINPSDVK